VEEFEYHGQRRVMIALVAAQTGGKNHKKRTEPLAAAAENVAADHGNQGDTGGQQTSHLRLDPFKIGSDPSGNPLLDVLDLGVEKIRQDGSVTR